MNMHESQVIVSFFPKRHEHFGPTIIPVTIKELHKYCAPLDIRSFGEGKDDKYVLDHAFNHWNYVGVEYMQAPDEINARASILKCHVSATAGDVFSISDDKSTRWYHCDNIGWSLIEMS